MAGQEGISRWAKYLGAYATNFPNNDIGLNDHELGNSERNTLQRQRRRPFALFLFARANYNFREKYLLTASQCVPTVLPNLPTINKWGFFPPVCFRCMAHERRRIRQKLNLFSDLKLRIGYGLAGNNRVASYTSS